MKLYVLTVLLALSCDLVSAQNARVGSYDLGDLDLDKANNNPDILDFVVEVIMEYDILVIQGIKSSEVLTMINDRLRDSYSLFKLDPSDDTSDEYFACFYNVRAASLTDSAVYSQSDKFSHSPVALQFSLTQTVLKVLHVAVVKIGPANPYEELDMIPAALGYFEDYFNGGDELDWVITGKFNRDSRCSNLTDMQLYSLEIVSSEYTYFIGTDRDTLTDPFRDCAPDMILVRGRYL